jgi:hypothetical protein
MTLPVQNAAEKIARAEAFIMALQGEHGISFENGHEFVSGVYCRTMYIPANTVNTSKTHLVENFVVLVQGHLTVVSTDGYKHDIRAPYLGITKPGTKRAVWAHEDSVLVTFHPNPDDCRDIEELERRFAE